jgi:hypothetical protein
MILKGNRRGGAKDLALHLMKEENDHVEVHELRGFVSSNLMGALNETYAISRGTRCIKFMYSMSVNPPPGEKASTADILSAIVRRHINWNTQGPDLEEDLAHPVQGIKRRICGIASAGIPSFSV